jgi:transposase-like protein
MSDTAKMGNKREGPPGRLSQVNKAVLERALTEEMTGHLGYDKHDPAGRESGNGRPGRPWWDGGVNRLSLGTVRGGKPVR